MAFLADKLETCRLIDAPGGYQHVVGPEIQFPLACLAGEADAFLHQPAADAQAARIGFDIEQSQFRDRVAFAHDEYAVGDFAGGGFAGLPGLPGGAQTISAMPSSPSSSVTSFRMTDV